MQTQSRAAGRAFFADSNTEPELEELLGDPIFDLLMRSDGIDPGELRRAIAARGRRDAPGG